MNLFHKFINLVTNRDYIIIHFQDKTFIREVVTWHNNTPSIDLGSVGYGPTRYLRLPESGVFNNHYIYGHKCSEYVSWEPLTPRITKYYKSTNPEDSTAGSVENKRSSSSKRK